MTVELPDFVVWELEMRDQTVEGFLIELVELAQEPDDS